MFDQKKADARTAKEKSGSAWGNDWYEQGILISGHTDEADFCEGAEPVINGRDTAHEGKGISATTKVKGSSQPYTR